MRKILTILFTILSCAAMAQKPVQTIGNKNNIVKLNGELSVDSAMLFPKDTIQLLSTDRGLSIKNNEVYIWRGSRWDSLSKLINAASAINNGLMSTGGITLVDSTLTINDTIKWSYNGVIYTKVTPSSFIINSADSGYYRRDLIYADTSGLLYKLVGTEDTARALVPSLPANSIVITIVDVYGNQIAPPVADSIGAIPNLQKVTNAGNSTTNPIFINSNSTQTALKITSEFNRNNYLYEKNSDSLNWAATGFVFKNNVADNPSDEWTGHWLKLMMGSTTNDLKTDGAIISTNGSGGMEFSSNSGRIVFSKGSVAYPYGSQYGLHPYSEMGAFETNGDFTLKKVDSANADINSVVWMDKDTVKKGHLNDITKLNISDTASMLSPYLRKVDSTNSTTGWTTLYQNGLKANITDTLNQNRNPYWKKWVIFGDSFSATSNHYYGRVDTLLHLTGTVTNGVSGNRFYQQSAKLDSILSANPTYFNSFNIASILLGVNDFAASDSLGTVNDSSNRTTCAGYLKHMIESILSANPNIELYVMTPPEANGAGVLYHATNSAGWTLTDLEVLISQICANYGVQCIDLHALANFNLQTIPTLTSDGLHPNYYGSIVLGNIIAQAFAGHNNKGNLYDSKSSIPSLQSVMDKGNSSTDSMKLGGTGTPKSMLELTSSAPVLSFSTTSNSNKYGIIFYNYTTPESFIKMQPNVAELQFNVGRNTTWGGNMTFYTDSVMRAKINDAGIYFYNPLISTSAITGTTITGTTLTGTTLTGTTLNLSGTITSSSNIFLNQTYSGTSYTYNKFNNAGGSFYLGQEGSTAGGFYSGSSAYASVLYSAKPIQLISKGIKELQVDSSGISVIGKAKYTTNPTMTTADSLTVPDKKYVDSVHALSILSASNGLTKTGNDVELGGNLTKTDSLTLNSKELYIMGAGTNKISFTDNGIYSNYSTATQAIKAVNTTGLGVYSSTSTGAPFYAERTDISGTISPMVSLNGFSTSTVAGQGYSIKAGLPTSSGSSSEEANISFIADKISAGSSGASIHFGTKDTSDINGVVHDKVVFNNDGKIQLNQYGQGNFQSTPAYDLSVTSTGNIVERRDTIPLLSFGYGSGLAADTIAASTSAIYGSMYNSGTDTLNITKMKIGLQGTSPSVTVTIYFNDSLGVTAGATKLVNAGSAATDIYTGTTVTSFDNAKIPPGNWVWCQLTSITTKPTYLSVTLIGTKNHN
jgi:hypothetical protein